MSDDATFFDASYRGTPPWDIGRPQREIVALSEAGAIVGQVLDVGCGTGENAMYLADRGLDVLGVDAAPRAIEKARAKARDRGSRATFTVGDVLDPGTLDQTFDTVIDCGLFHTLSDDDRLRFAASLRTLLPRGGRYHMLCFSEHQPGTLGPRRVTQREIREAFARGWGVEQIRPAVFETLLPHGDVRAWLASIVRA